MASRIPLVIVSGEVKQLPSGDTLNLQNQPITVTLTNRTGGALAGKECVIIDDANDNSVKFCTVAADKRKAVGIVTVGGANLAEVVIQITGKVTAVAGGTGVTRGDIVETGTAGDGRVITNNAANTTGIGKALTGAAAGSDLTIILGTV